MYNMNKKAISDIVTSVLIILLILVSISLVSMSVFKLVNNPTLSPGESCPIMQFNKVVKIFNVCLNQETNDTEITLERTLDEKYQINSLDFIIDKNQETAKYKCGNQCGECKILSQGSLKTYYINSNENSAKLDLIVNNCIIDTKNIINC